MYRVTGCVCSNHAHLQEHHLVNTCKISLRCWALKVLIGSLTILLAAWQIHEYCKKRRTEKRLEKKKESRVIEDNALTALVQEERHPIFFLIGSPRSGSSWLYTNTSESKVIAKPHPTHILKRFTPILDKFGDLFEGDICAH